MKKQILLRGLLGIPVGIAIGCLITIFVSLGIADGSYYPCVPALATQVGSEINAVVLQMILCAVLGAVFGSASVIWEMDNWSIAKQTGIYFSVTALAMLPIAYITHWMEHSFVGFLIYFGIFFAIFIVMWLMQYYIVKSKIKKMNLKVKKPNNL